MTARTTRRTGLIALVLAGSMMSAPVTVAGEDPPPRAAKPCAAVAGTELENVRLTTVTPVPAGTFTPPGGDAPLADLPAFCRVAGTISPVPGSRIGFEVWMPDEGWTRRIHMVGNGGYSSAISYDLMADLVRRRDVAVATDTGHTGSDLRFGKDNPGTRADWGHRAVHESIVAAKGVVRDRYGRPESYAYFSGCSTGGHQALMEAQRYPGDFDGILAGSPGNNRTNLNLAFLWQFLQNHEPGDNRTTILDDNDLRMIGRAVVARFDAVDGVVDGVVNDPSRISFSPESFRCAAGANGGCLTDRQIAAVKAMYQGPTRRGTGEVLYQGWPAGSEWVDDGRGGGSGWNRYWANPERPEEPQRADYFRYWAGYGPEWDWWEFDWDEDVDEVRRTLGPIVDATSPDLSAFQERGGKLIMFTGWQDPVVSARDTIAYYDQVFAVQEPTVQRFARLFMVPGMAHCAGGPGATSFSSTTQGATAPLRADAEHDVSLALQRWVEEGEALDRIVAARYVDPADTAQGVEFTRPLCAYPQIAVYREGEEPTTAASFQCQEPPAGK